MFCYCLYSKRVKRCKQPLIASVGKCLLNLGYGDIHNIARKKKETFKIIYIMVCILTCKIRVITVHISKIYCEIILNFSKYLIYSKCLRKGHLLLLYHFYYYHHLTDFHIETIIVSRTQCLIVYLTHTFCKVVPLLLLQQTHVHQFYIFYCIHH